MLFGESKSTSLVQVRYKTALTGFKKQHFRESLPPDQRWKSRLSLYREPRYSFWHNYVTQVSQTTMLGLEPQPYHALPSAIFRRLRVLLWLHHPCSVGILLNINAETASRVPNSPHIHPETDCGIYILSFYCKESFYFSHLKSSNVWQMKVQDWLKIYVSILCSYWQYRLLGVEILTWSWAKNMVCSHSSCPPSVHLTSPHTNGPQLTKGQRTINVMLSQCLELSLSLAHSGSSQGLRHLEVRWVLSRPHLDSDFDLLLIDKLSPQAGE